MSDRRICPACGRYKLVEPYRPPKARLALIGTQPGDEEIRQGRPFVGPTGQLLHHELARVGIVWTQAVASNLWMHARPKKKAECDAEIAWHKEQLIKLLDGVEAVFLMGAENLQVWAGCSVMDVCGLEVEVPEFPDSVQIVVASVNPAYALRNPVGELRFAIREFARRVGRWTD